MKCALAVLIGPLLFGCSRSEPVASQPEAAVQAAPPACLGLGPEADACQSADSVVSSSALRNVLGQPLQPCSTDPMTGWTREGVCNTGPTDTGVHVVCAEMTDAFLEYTKARGNDLSTPHPEFHFPGLRSGDRWCLCAARWAEADDAGVAPPPVVDATHEAALKFIDAERLAQ